MITLTGIPMIETARLRLRGPKPADFEAFAAFAASSRATYIGGAVGRIHAWRNFCHLTGHWLHRGYSMFILADRVTDAPLGSAGPWFPEGWPEPEIGWSIWDQGAEGRGLAHEAALATRAYAYENLGWTTAISLILDGNVKSQALALRMGCHLESDFTHEQFGKCNIYRHPQRVPA